MRSLIARKCVAAISSIEHITISHPGTLRERLASRNQWFTFSSVANDHVDQHVNESDAVKSSNQSNDNQPNESTAKSGSASPWAVYDDAWTSSNEAPRTCPGTVVDPTTNHERSSLLSPESVKIGDTVLEPGSETKILEAFDEHLKSRSSSHFGYPYNLEKRDYTELFPLLKYSINNLGDPFIPSNYGVHSRQFEVAGQSKSSNASCSNAYLSLVIDFFAKLWKLEESSYWGYVTTSGTEGNLHGILLARELFPDGILYTSRETHYSVFKAARYYRMQCKSIPTLHMGEIDYSELALAIDQNRDKPVILNVNIGTTVKGAVDDLDRILRILDQLNIPRERFYIHCDGALFALMMPFIDYAPEVNFQKPIDSMAVSGHKMLGCPMPCGVALTRKKHVELLENRIDYLNSVDTTIMGSRNGQAALFMWYSLRKKGLHGIKQDVKQCMDVARYLRDRLLSENLRSCLNDLSTTVVLERPLEDAFVKKWQLACEEDIAHVVVMPNVTETKVDQFVHELLESISVHGRIDPCRANSPLTKLEMAW